MYKVNPTEAQGSRKVRLRSSTSSETGREDPQQAKKTETRKAKRNYVVKKTKTTQQVTAVGAATRSGSSLRSETSRKRDVW